MIYLFPVSLFGSKGQMVAESFHEAQMNVFHESARFIQQPAPQPLSDAYSSSIQTRS
jgi:hypothetical protein